MRLPLLINRARRPTRPVVGDTVTENLALIDPQEGRAEVSCPAFKRAESAESACGRGSVQGRGPSRHRHIKSSLIDRGSRSAAYLSARCAHTLSLRPQPHVRSRLDLSDPGRSTTTEQAPMVRVQGCSQLVASLASFSSSLAPSAICSCCLADTSFNAV